MNIEERISLLKSNLFLNWKKDNDLIGIKRYKVLRLMGEEKGYLKNKAIAQLRKEKYLMKNMNYYFVLKEFKK
jgi:hypothetical protein